MRAEVIVPGFSVAPLSDPDGPAFAQVYALAGRYILVETSDREIRDLFTHYFTAWHIERVDARPIPPHVTIVAAAGNPTAASRSDEFFAVAEGGICFTDASSYFFASDGSTVEATSGRAPRVSVWFGNSSPATKSVGTTRVIFNAAMTAMRRCGLYELHAAGVVSPSGRGVLIIGPSGSGKSTLATQLAAAGWGYLSDDMLLVYENDGTIEARALRRVFALTNETFETLDDLQLPAAAIEPFDPLKKRFEPGDIFPHGFCQKCAPETLFFSRISDEPQSSTHALSRTETLAQLLRMCPWACYDRPIARAHFKALSDLARQARGFELSVGRDLFGAPECTSRYLMAYAE